MVCFKSFGVSGDAGTPFFCVSSVDNVGRNKLHNHCIVIALSLFFEKNNYQPPPRT